MKHDDFKKQLRGMSEDIEIPESLKPEQIQKRLEQEKTKKSTHISKKTIFSLGTLSAAALLLFVALNGDLIASPNSANSSVPEAADGVYIGEAADSENLTVSGMKTPDSYEELHELLLKYNKETKYFDSEDSGRPGFVEETITESSNDSASGNSKEYSDTNEQVEGVNEGDIIKTDGNYIYMLNQQKGCLQILKADKTEITLLSEIYPPDNNEKQSYYQAIDLAGNYGFDELYLHDNRLVLIKTSWDTTAHQEDLSSYYRYYNPLAFTEIFIYDISNRSTPMLVNSVTQDGYYQSSRKNGDFLYLFSYYDNFLDDASAIPEQYIPSVNKQMIPTECIYLPENINSTGHLVMTAINIVAEKPDFTDQLSVIAQASDYYVSQDNIYVVSTSYYSTKTEIMKFSYHQGNLTAAAKGSIDGQLHNSFSLDEYGGFLRTVVTAYENGDTVNRLIILNDRLETISRIDGIARGEQIYSARFIGNTAYFVTFRQVDPLFLVDLSDPYEPQILGELKIPGFSNYLHLYDDGLLLGIGQEADERTGITEGIKLSMFDVSDPANLSEIHKLVLPDGQYSPALYNHKAVLISPEQNLIGFMVEGTVWNQRPYDWFSEYRTFSYDSEQGFSEDIVHSMATDGYYTESRGLFIGDYLYIMGEMNHLYIYNRVTNEYLTVWQNLN